MSFVTVKFEVEVTIESNHLPKDMERAKAYAIDKINEHLGVHDYTFSRLMRVDMDTEHAELENWDLG